MSPLSVILNVLWIVCGGLYMAAGWLIAAAIMVLTIVGIPWAKAAFNIAFYALLPFGQQAVSRREHLGRDDIGTGPLGVLGNIIAPGGSKILGSIIGAGAGALIGRAIDDGDMVCR